jgi:hypothetical protein
MQPLDGEQIYQLNMSVIKDRWPLFAEKIDQADLSVYQFELTLGDTTTVSVNGIQLTSRHDPEAEAEIQANATPTGAMIFLYGFGLGFLADHLLKTRRELKRLEIRVTNAAIFKFVLGILDVTGITKQSKVNMSLACDDMRVVGPYFAHPESLTLCDDDSLKIRDHITHAVRMAYVNSIFSSDLDLLKRVEDFDFHKNGNAKAVKKLFKMSRPGKVCIVASGPSLEDNIEKLKAILNESNNNIIIACDTAALALNSYGIKPDFVVTIDKGINSSYFKGLDTKSISLIFHPTTSKDFIDSWDGPKYYAISSVFMCGHLKKTESINTLIANGSVIHPVIDLGVAMGYKELIFFGADFSFIKNKTHAYWQSGKLGGSINNNYKIFNGKGEKVPSAPNMAAYLITTEALILRNKNVKFYNTSLEGAKITGTTQI